MNSSKLVTIVAEARDISKAQAQAILDSVGRGGPVRSSARSRVALPGEPRFQCYLGLRGVLTSEKLMAFPAEGADAAPAPDQRMLRKQCRFDRQNVIARDVPSRVDAFENDMQRGTVAVGNIRHAESSAQLCLASNAKFESVMLIRFQ
jgi:hypothetical protein